MDSLDTEFFCSVSSIWGGFGGQMVPFLRCGPLSEGLESSVGRVGWRSESKRAEGNIGDEQRLFTFSKQVNKSE